MIWKIEFKPTAEKHYNNLDKKTVKKVKKALRELQDTEEPALLTNVKSETVTLYGDYRLSVGEWKVVFTPDEKKKILYVFGIIPGDDVQ